MANTALDLRNCADGGAFQQVGEHLAEDERHDVDERAAIHEFDDGLDRDAAERAALATVLRVRWALSLLWCGRVRVRKKVLETAFLAELERMRPRPEFMKLFREIVLDAWHRRLEGGT